MKTKTTLSLLLLSLCCLVSCASDGSSEMKEGYVNAENGVQLYYRVIGEGEETVVIPAAVYLSVELAEVAQGRRVIFYDVRNRGRSKAINDSSLIGMNYDISDLETIRNHFNLEKMSLIGWSYLGAMVTLYALEHQDHVNRIVQIGPLPPRRDPYMKTFSPPIDSTDLARINEMQKEGKDKSDPNRYAREYMEAVMKNMFHDPSKISQFRSDYYTLPNEMPENVFFQIGCIFNSLGEWDWRAKLKTLTIPVLTCYGESERQTEAFHEWVGFLPNARLLFIPRAGHFPFVENRDVLITAIERFLSGEWPESAESIEIENLEISDKL